MTCVTLHPLNLSLWFQLKMGFYPFENTGMLQPEVRFLLPARPPAHGVCGQEALRGFCVGRELHFSCVSEKRPSRLGSFSVLPPWAPYPRERPGPWYSAGSVWVCVCEMHQRRLRKVAGPSPWGTGRPGGALGCPVLASGSCVQGQGGPCLPRGAHCGPLGVSGHPLIAVAPSLSLVTSSSRSQV